MKAISHHASSNWSIKLHVTLHPTASTVSQLCHGLSSALLNSMSLHNALPQRGASKAKSGFKWWCDQIDFNPTAHNPVCFYDPTIKKILTLPELSELSDPYLNFTIGSKIILPFNGNKTELSELSDPYLNFTIGSKILLPFNGNKTVFRSITKQFYYVEFIYAHYVLTRLPFRLNTSFTL